MVAHLPRVHLIWANARNRRCLGKSRNLTFHRFSCDESCVPSGGVSCTAAAAGSVSRRSRLRPGKSEEKGPWPRQTPSQSVSPRTATPQTCSKRRRFRRHEWPCVAPPSCAAAALIQNHITYMPQTERRVPAGGAPSSSGSLFSPQRAWPARVSEIGIFNKVKEQVRLPALHLLDQMPP